MAIRKHAHLWQQEPQLPGVLLPHPNLIQQPQVVLLMFQRLIPLGILIVDCFYLYDFVFLDDDFLAQVTETPFIIELVLG